MTEIALLTSEMDSPDKNAVLDLLELREGIICGDAALVRSITETALRQGVDPVYSRCSEQFRTSGRTRTVANVLRAEGIDPALSPSITVTRVEIPSPALLPTAFLDTTRFDVDQSLP